MNKVEEFYAQKKGTFLLESKKRDDIMAEVKAYLDEDTIIAEMSNLMEVTPLDQWSINKFLREIRDKARAGKIKQTVETVEVVEVKDMEIW